MSPSPVPPGASYKFYQATNGKKGAYYIWHRNGKWIWQALGNSGEALSEYAAEADARTWIRDGVSSLRPPSRGSASAGDT